MLYWVVVFRWWGYGVKALLSHPIYILSSISSLANQLTSLLPVESFLLKFVCLFFGICISLETVILYDACSINFF